MSSSTRQRVHTERSGPSADPSASAAASKAPPHSTLDPKLKNVASKSERRPQHHDHDHDDHHDHDHPIDGAQLDNLLWEISKFCIPVGLILYLSIFLCYRHELLDWFTRTHPTTTAPNIAQRGAPQVVERDIGPGARPHHPIQANEKAYWKGAAAEPVPAQNVLPQEEGGLDWRRSAVSPNGGRETGLDDVE